MMGGFVYVNKVADTLKGAVELYGSQNRWALKRASSLTRQCASHIPTARQLAVITWDTV